VPPPITMPGDGSDLNAIVYLEVWQRLITALEDDILREVALGGPDMTARIKTVVQVRVAVVPQTSPVTLLTCANAGQFLPLPNGGTLTTLQPQLTQPADLCQLPDPNNFTGPENRLYRVEIHEGGDPVGSTDNSVLVVPLAQDAPAGATTLSLQQALSVQQIDAVTCWGVITVADSTGRLEKAAIAAVADNGQSVTLTQGLTNAFTAAHAAFIQGIARFKWSLDNASFAVLVTAVSADRQTLTLSSLGRDQATMLRQGDLVEICDDVSELGSARGHLTNLQSDPDPDLLTVVIADPLPLNFQAPASEAAGPSTSPPPSPPIRPSSAAAPLGWPGYCSSRFQRDRPARYGSGRRCSHPVRRRQSVAWRLLAVHCAQHRRLGRGPDQCTAGRHHQASLPARGCELEPAPARESACQPAAQPARIFVVSD